MYLEFLDESSTSRHFFHLLMHFNHFVQKQPLQKTIFVNFSAFSESELKTKISKKKFLFFYF